MINYDEAYKIVLTEITNLNLGHENVPLVESVGRISAADIYSEIELPAFNNSAMDGIGIRFSSDLKKWKVVSEISAGNYSERNIQENECMLIMTGAKIPDFVDSVIPFEDIIIEDGYAELIHQKIAKRNQNIRYKGNELSVNDLILGKNIFIKPGNVSILAACGQELIKVYRKINFGIFATGDELIEINETPYGDKIRASNLYSLISLIKNVGMDFVNMGIVKDDKSILKNLITSGLDKDVNILVSTGGVSAGIYDHVPEILDELGFEILFRKVNIKPGKPCLFAEKITDDKKMLYFGLPGNPVSAFVNFIIFIQRAVYEGIFNYPENLKEVILNNDISKTDTKRHFVRGIVSKKNKSGLPVFNSLGNQSSSNVKILGDSDALLLVEEEIINPKKGDLLKCITI